MAEDKHIIVIRKRKQRNAHHGGAWKVAYADFVTAMMALFILLWLMNVSSKHTQELIASYFRDPAGTSKITGSNQLGSSQNVSLNRKQMTQLRQTLMQSILHVNNLSRLKNQIEMTITPEGLRIELMEDPNGTFFKRGSIEPTPVLVQLLKLLAAQIGSLPNRISIEGHTDAAPYAGNDIYSNWELSADRANVARRLMQANGLHANQVSQMRGFAAERLRDPAHPFAACNRRISLIIQWPDAGTTAEAAEALAHAPGSEATTGEGPTNPAGGKIAATPALPHVK
jgi:chemotaxis protein MotB